MKTWTLRINILDKHIFDEIKEGAKTIETRAATEKYRGIERGDTLLFVCGKQKLKREVKSVAIFRSIDIMTSRIPFRKIMPSIESIEELRNVYYGYPSYREKIKKWGIIAFKI